MKFLKLFLYHLLTFVIGAVMLGLYFAYKISVLPPKDALAGLALLPVALVYIGSFGILCLISLSVSFLFVYFKRTKPQTI
jgi:hypothetical protein